MLVQWDKLPSGFLEANSLPQLYQCFNGPTLIHLTGKISEPLFVSTLLHGNETTGLLAVQNLLQDYVHQELPRSLSIFIGNVEAARWQRRCLDGQPDYNRIWQVGDTPEHAMMQQVLEEMKQRKIFASVDIHNNTGVNPHYACVNRLENPFFRLATLFSRTVIYFLRPQGVQSIAFAKLCPSVTVECGRVGEREGIEHAQAFLRASLQLQDLSADPLEAREMELFQTVARVEIPSGVTFGFGDSKTQIVFESNLDHLNFRELPTGTCLGNLEKGIRLNVTDQKGKGVGRRYFNYTRGKIQTKVPVTPSMFTLDHEVVRQDCLGYLMKRLDLSS